MSGISFRDFPEKQDAQLEYFLKQAQLASQSGLETDSIEYHTGLASILYNLGSTYLIQKLYPLSAIFCLEECRDIKIDKLKQTGPALYKVNNKLKLAQQLLAMKKREERPV